MYALRYDAPRAARLVAGDAPRAQGKQSVALTLATSVSAGTEMGFYRGTAPQMNSRMNEQGLFEPCAGCLAYPMQSDAPGVWWMGYSTVGKVQEVGPDEHELRVGDLVWVQQGHKSALVSDQFLKLPADTNVEHAALIALINIAYNGMLDARVKLLDEVVILGMGTLGQLLLQMCRRSGARVTAVDHLDSRLQLAKQLGAETIINPSKEGDLGQLVQRRTGGAGADVIFEVSGSVDALGDAIRCAGYEGKVVVLSFYQRAAESLHLGREFHHKRITLRCSQIGGINPELAPRYNADRRMRDVLSLLKMLELEPLISHRVRFEQLPEALAMIDQNPAACQAVIVKYT